MGQFLRWDIAICTCYQHGVLRPPMIGVHYKKKIRIVCFFDLKWTSHVMYAGTHSTKIVKKKHNFSGR